MANPEQLRGGGERTAELERAAAERSAELREKLHGKERPEQNSEHLAKEARAEAEKQARPAEDVKPKGELESNAGPSYQTARTPDAAYKETMTTIQKEMSAPARAFSKVIHNKTVEKVSDLAGSTVARPNSILSGSIFAFILVLAVYVHAKNIGYSLSGFETIGAFILGWIIGILYDALRAMLTGKR
ncbi:MAG TPA: hypothetical protein VFO38_05290 [Candidatus Saccharimonadales bacterium]|nr:hypothetical protein [Candidatus Saccharimonadales bacterium]